MKKRMVRSLIFLVLAAMMVTMLSGLSFAAGVGSLKTYVDSYTQGNGSFSLTSGSRIYVVSTSAPTGQFAKTLQLIASQFAAKSVPTATPMSIVYGPAASARDGDLIVQADNSLSGEAYRIEITSSNATIYFTAGAANLFYGGEGSYNSLLYGGNTLLKLFITNGSSTVSCCTISDAPDTAERTLQLDIARKYWTVDWVKNLIREASWMGYNTLDLHMTEDQGYRANIWRDRNGNTVLDCNGNDFNWAMGGNIVSWNKSYYDTTNGIYSRDDLIEIIECAKEYHIEIIPAVDFPTHADALIAKFNSNFVNTGTNFSFQFDGKTYTGRSSLSVDTTQTINIVDDYARNLAFAVTQAYADFFADYGCTKFNIGADEVAGASRSWATASYTTQHGGSIAKDAYVIFINELAGILQRNAYGADNHNYRVRAFNDCLFGTGFYFYGSYTPDRTQATIAVNPDIDVLFWTASGYHTSPSTLAAQGRTVYNCINWYTYYVLRYDTANNTGEARSDNCTQWTFNHASPERIYSGCGRGCKYGSNCSGEGWNPTKFWGCTTGEYRETVTTNLGGGYFLVWGDWAGWDDQTSIWNSDGSTSNNGSANYNLIKRMWSNAAKQWSWSVDSKLSFSDFSTYREAVRHYPGFIDCNSAPRIPASGTIESAIDRSALAELLDNVLDRDNYTASSYEAYEKAVEAGRTVYNDAAASQQTIDEAVTAIRSAMEKLQTVPATMTISLVCKIGGTEKLIDSIELGAEINETYLVDIPSLTGYHYASVSGATFVPSPFGTSCGYVLATATQAKNQIKVYYDNDPYLAILKAALRITKEDKGYANYAAYAEALQEAQSFYDRVSASPATLTEQSEVNAMVRALLLAQLSLATESDTTEIQSCGFETAYVAAGKVAVLKVNTTPDVTGISVTCGGKDVQLIYLASREEKDGTKTWRLRFAAPEVVGDYTYTVTAQAAGRNAEATAALTVQ